MTERTGWEYYKYKRYLGILSRKVLHTGFRLMRAGSLWIRTQEIGQF